MAIKISSLILDPLDEGAERIFAQLPADLHKVPHPDVVKVAGLSDGAFAMLAQLDDGTLRRRFPLDTADNVKLSRAFFDITKNQLPEEVQLKVEEAIKNAEAGKPFAPAWFKTSQVNPSRVVVPECCWGLSVSDKNYFPLHNAGMVKEAMSRWPISTATLAPQQKYCYAQNLMKRAEELGVEVPKTAAVNAYAGKTLCLNALHEAIQQRKEATGSTVLDALDMLAKPPTPRYALEVAETQKLAEAATKLSAAMVIPMLEQFDRAHNLGNAEYQRGLRDPYAACFSTKHAESNTVVNGVDLSAVPGNKLIELIGPEAAAQFQDNPVMVFNSFPTPVQEAIASLAKSGGDGIAGEFGPQSAEDKQEQDIQSPPMSGEGGDAMRVLNPAFGGQGPVRAL